MLLRIVLVKYKAGQLHDSEVKDQVPENYWVIIKERLLCQDSISLLRKSIDELFVQCYRLKQLHWNTILSIDKSSLVL